MKKAGLDPSRLDAIFLSHLHGDHCGGVPFFFLEFLYGSRERPLHVAGPAGTEERLRSLFQLMFGDVSQPKELPATAFHLLCPGRPQTIAGVPVYPFRVPHQERYISLGLKLTLQGKQILYSGDSAWTDLFIAHSQDADLFLCECSFFDRDTVNHMSYRELKGHFPQLGCKQLVLTHMSEEMLARRERLPAVFAEDGMIFEL
jgi:ribonuclease BN (tRNA processing enzyme)